MEKSFLPHSILNFTPFALLTGGGLTLDKKVDNLFLVDNFLTFTFFKKNYLKSKQIIKKIRKTA